MTKPKPKPEDLFQGGFAGKGDGEKPTPPKTGSGVAPAPARAKGKTPTKTKPQVPAPKTKPQLPAVVAPPEPPNLLSMIGQAITSPTVDGEKLTKLVDWYDRRNADNAYARDFLAMAEELPAIKQDGTIDQGITGSGKRGVRSKYATFRNIHEVTSPILHRHGFTLSSYNTIVGQETMLVLRLEHYDPRFGSSFRESIRPIVSDQSGGKTTVQAIESGAQYFLRRMVIKLLNLRSAAPEDDDRDGNPPKPPSKPAAEPEPAIKVTAAQLKALREKIAKTDGRITDKRVCEKAGVERLEDIAGSQLPDLHKALDNVIGAVSG